MRHVDVREKPRSVAAHTHLEQDWTCNPGVCPAWDWKGGLSLGGTTPSPRSHASQEKPTSFLKTASAFQHAVSYMHLSVFNHSSFFFLSLCACVHVGERERERPKYQNVQLNGLSQSEHPCNNSRGGMWSAPRKSPLQLSQHLPLIKVATYWFLSKSLPWFKKCFTTKTCILKHYSLILLAFLISFFFKRQGRQRNQLAASHTQPVRNQTHNLDMFPETNGHTGQGVDFRTSWWKLAACFLLHLISFLQNYVCDINPSCSVQLKVHLCSLLTLFCFMNILQLIYLPYCWCTFGQFQVWGCRDSPWTFWHGHLSLLGTDTGAAECRVTMPVYLSVKGNASKWLPQVFLGLSVGESSLRFYILTHICYHWSFTCSHSYGCVESHCDFNLDFSDWIASLWSARSITCPFSYWAIFFILVCKSVVGFFFFNSD